MQLFGGVNRIVIRGKPLACYNQGGPKTMGKQAELTPAELRKATGSHYTPSRLAEFVADKIVAAYAKTSRTKTPIRVLDPAVGDGILLVSLLRRLVTNGFDEIEVTGYDTNALAVRRTAELIREEFPAIQCRLHAADFLDLFMSMEQDDLFQTAQEFDLVIANPPYVRTQVLGADRAQRIAERFGLSGRVDLAYPFIKGMAQVLAPNGVVGVITSNRFMTTKAGASIREHLQTAVDVLHVWDMGDTKLFEAAVLPAVILFERKGSAPTQPPKFTSVYLSKSETPTAHAGTHLRALELEGIVGLPDGTRCIVRHGSLNLGKDSSDVWRIGSNESDAWLSTVKAHTALTFGDVGKIKVGVKTTADSVFIRSDWDEMPAKELPELLRPLTTHHFATRWRTVRPAQAPKILYPHTILDGRRAAVKLEDYPRTAKYLRASRKELEGRTYVIESGREWYEIWVPHDPEVWKRPKVVFRDISERPTFWMDLEGSVVNGDCYWLISASADEDLLWLALAVGNSTFIETFYDVRFNNKLYSSRRRFMTQYVEQFPLPNPRSPVARRVIELAKRIYREDAAQVAELEKEVDASVWRAFNLRAEEVPR